MKFKNLLVLFFITVTAIGCKDEGKNQGGSTSADTFKLELTLVAKKDDNFCLLYTKDGSLNFKDGVWKGVKGSETEQSLEFSLPSGVFPTQLRFDFGLKPDQEDIVLKSIVLEYKDKKRKIAGVELANFFRADLNKCTFDAGSGIIKALVVNGVKQSPSLYPQEAYLGPELKKLGK
jgi:hypothetical protein